MQKRHICTFACPGEEAEVKSPRIHRSPGVWAYVVESFSCSHDAFKHLNLQITNKTKHRVVGREVNICMVVIFPPFLCPHLNPFHHFASHNRCMNSIANSINSDIGKFFKNLTYPRCGVAVLVYDDKRVLPWRGWERERTQKRVIQYYKSWESVKTETNQRWKMKGRFSPTYIPDKISTLVREKILII